MKLQKENILDFLIKEYDIKSTNITIEDSTGTKTINLIKLIQDSIEHLIKKEL